jgi:hypothetical protein
MGKVMQGIRLKNGEFKTDKKGKAIQIEVEDEGCLYKSDVLKIIGEKNWIKFAKWMTGQGAPIMSDGSLGYFAWDVDKFKRHYVDGIPPLTREEVGEIIMNGTFHGEKVQDIINKEKRLAFNKTKKKKKSSKNRCTIKRTKVRWNKKKGIQEVSKKGSKDKICLND